MQNVLQYELTKSKILNVEKPNKSTRFKYPRFNIISVIVIMVFISGGDIIAHSFTEKNDSECM